MLNFIGACGFESSIENERKNHDACIKEYNGRVISVRCIQASNKNCGGFVVWVFSKNGKKLNSDYKMNGIATDCSDLPILIRETKKFIDTL